MPYPRPYRRAMHNARYSYTKRHDREAADVNYARMGHRGKKFEGQDDVKLNGTEISERVGISSEGGELSACPRCRRWGVMLGRFPARRPKRGMRA